MGNLLSQTSIVLNRLITGEKNKPLCYTAYDRKSIWAVIFDRLMFWDKQHCRKVWLRSRIHETNKKD